MTRRHVLDREDEAGQVDHRHQEEEHRRHHRLLLRVGDRRDEQPEAERGQQVDEAQREQQQEAAAQRHVEPEHGHAEHEEARRSSRSGRRAAACRRSAPTGASGVTFSCSSVPSSFSRTIAIDDRIDRHDEQQQREHARDHEVAALELRVEPDAHVGSHAAPGSARPAAAAPRGELLRVGAPPGSSRTRAPPVEFASVPSATTCTTAGRPRPTLPAVAGRDRQGHPGPAALEVRRRCRSRSPTTEPRS